jgi:hydrogenase maturation protease
MTAKLLAIGNRLMGDDGIAIKVGENISEALENKGIEVVIGETDIYYCLSEIFDVDIVFILDATYYATIPGTITINSIKDFKICTNKQFSQHGINLIKLIEIYKVKKKIYVIGIEIDEIIYSLNISSALNSKLKNICSEVQETILDIYQNI